MCAISRFDLKSLFRRPHITTVVLWTRHNVVPGRQTFGITYKGVEEEKIHEKISF